MRYIIFFIGLVVIIPITLFLTFSFTYFFMWLAGAFPFPISDIPQPDTPVSFWATLLFGYKLRDVVFLGIVFLSPYLSTFSWYKFWEAEIFPHFEKKQKGEATMPKIV